MGAPGGKAGGGGGGGRIVRINMVFEQPAVTHPRTAGK